MTRAFTFATALALILATSGCASRLISPESSSAPAPASLDLTANAPSGLRLTVRHVIPRDGPGSWVKEANWIEFAVTLANAGNEAVTVYSLELASTLPANPMHTASLAMLEEESRNNARFYRSLGRGFGIPGVAAAAAAAAGGLGGVAIAILALPVALVGGGVYVMARSSRDKADLKLIEEELARRGLNTPARIAAGSELSGSAFFPLTVAPTQLIVRYQDGPVVPELAVELPQAPKP